MRRKMRQRMARCMIKIALLLAAAQAASAQPASEPVPETRVSHSVASDGAWDGGITVPAGLMIPFKLDLAGTSGRFAAPDQHVQDVPVTVTTDGNHVVVTLPGGSARFVATLSADGTVFAGTWTRGDQSFPARFTRRLASVQTLERPQTPRAPFPYSAEEQIVPAGSGIVLGATFTRPTNGDALPAVLLIGGNGPQDRDETYAGHRPMMLVADRLSRAGFAVLRYDKRGVGKSTGRYDTATAADLVSDARAALAWLRARPGVDPGRTCVLGLSEGAMIAPLVALADSPACVLLLSPPAVRAPELLGEQARLAQLDKGSTPTVAQAEGRLTQAILEGMVRGETRDTLIARGIAAGATRAHAETTVRALDAPEVRVFLDDDPGVPLRQLSMPVLVIAGANDHQVAPSLNLPRARAALAGNRAARILLLPGLNHVLQPARTGAVSEYATTEMTIDEGALSEIVGFAREASISQRRQKRR
jgi:uncharacterized protein